MIVNRHIASGKDQMAPEKPHIVIEDMKTNMRQTKRSITKNLNKNNYAIRAIAYSRCPEMRTEANIGDFRSISNFPYEDFDITLHCGIRRLVKFS